MADIENLTIKKAQEMIIKGETSVREVVSSYFDRIKKEDKDIHAYLELFEEEAFEIAEEQDKRILSGEGLKSLTGVPMAIKDNILIEGKIASAGSKILENYHATYSATVAEKLRANGAIFLGRANMDEFAMGSSTENSAFGPTRNPFDLSRVPGGSSGGSAAAVAMGGAMGAIGSDTGGSIRQPASFCGVVGLKPTYGAVSRYGLMAMASSLDQIGPLARTVEDAEIIFNVIKGGDKSDSTSTECKFQAPNAKSQTLKIGILKYDKKGVDEEINQKVKEAGEFFAGQGHEVKEIDLPGLDYALACYYIIMPAEVSANLARFDGVRYGLSKKGANLIEDYMITRAEGFGKEVRRRIMLGTYVLSAGYYDEFYGQAQKVRLMIKNGIKKAFSEADAILMPVSPTPAFKVGEKTGDPLQMYLSDIFTVSMNLAGVPAISVPCGLSSGKLPIGLQIVAPHFGEELLFRLGKELEKKYGRG